MKTIPMLAVAGSAITYITTPPLWVDPFRPRVSIEATL